MNVASKCLGIVPYKEKKNYPEKDRIIVVRTIQRYSLENNLRPEVVDLFLLIEGGQKWTIISWRITIPHLLHLGVCFDIVTPSINCSIQGGSLFHLSLNTS
jgi:hypothetical protein